MDTDTLHEVLDELTGQDLSMLVDGEVHELVMGLLKARSRLDGALFEALGVWDSRKVWNDDGSKSPGLRIAAEAGWKKAAANQALARARTLRSMPATGEAIRAGRLTGDYVEVLHDAAEVELDVPFTDYEQVLVDACVTAGYAESCRQIARWIAKHDPDGDDERARKRQAKRGVSAAETFQGLVHVQGLLPRVGGQEWLTELNRLERQLYLADNNNGKVRTAAQRRADAMVEMARRSAALDDAEVAAGRRSRVVMTVVVGLNTVEHLCELLGGTALAPGELVPLLDRLDIERMVFDGPDRDVTKVSSQRCFTGALRRAIQIRDRWCTHPSMCDTPADRCDVDHTLERIRGGETSIRNGDIECPPHNRNRDLHDRAPNGWRITRIPYGQIPDTGTRPRARRNRTCDRHRSTVDGTDGTDGTDGDEADAAPSAEA